MSSPAAAAALPALLEEILIEIFLRLDDASAACAAFLRVVRFLRRNRPLYHRPPVVVFIKAEGFSPLHTRSLHHAEPPHPSASAARALAQTADFALSSLPDLSSWRVVDATGGRLLLASRPAAYVAGLEDLVVCDPLYRRHVRIPPIPVDLTGGTPGVGAHKFAFLAPAGEEEEGSWLAVVWLVLFDSKVNAFVFSSVTREWRLIQFNGWRHYNAMLTSCRHHPHRSLCRTAGSFTEVLMLDTHKMEFSVIHVPCVRVCRQHAIAEAGEGRLGFLTLGDGVLDLYYKAWQSDGVSAEEWQHERTIPLPDGLMYSYTFSGVGAGYLLLQAVPLPQDTAESADHVPQMPAIHYFTLKLKTMAVERLCVLNKRVEFAHLYANFLPPLSLPSV